MDSDVSDRVTSNTLHSSRTTGNRQNNAAVKDIYVPHNSDTYQGLWSRDSSVGIVTRYGLDDPGIEPRCGRDFPHLSRPALGPTQPPVQWVPGLSRG